MDFGKDYYSVLGVEKNATDEEISSAYRKLMLKWHPDRFATKSKEEQDEATKKCAEINEANDILSDKKKRMEYDSVRNGNRRMGGFGNPFANAAGMGGFGFRDFDIFDENKFGNPFANAAGMGGFGFGGFQNFNKSRHERHPQTGKNVLIQVELPFEDFFFGCKKTFEVKVDAKCAHCNLGIVGDFVEYEKCTHCNGDGVRVSGGNGMIIRETCQNCCGTGKIIKNKCPVCHGTSIDGKRVQTIEFEIPKNTKTGFYEKTYSGVGHAGIYGGDCGDITINVRMGNSGMFFSRGNGNLGTIHFVNVFKAMSGGYETILTPYGKKNILIPRGMEDGHEMRFNGMGFKSDDGVSEDGDLFVIFKYDFPKNVKDEKMNEAISSLAEMSEKNGECFENVDAERKYVETYIERLNGLNENHS